MTTARSRRGNAELRDDADVSGDPLTAATHSDVVGRQREGEKKPHSLEVLRPANDEHNVGVVVSCEVLLDVLCAGVAATATLEQQ